MRRGPVVDVRLVAGPSSTKKHFYDEYDGL